MTPAASAREFTEAKTHLEKEGVRLAWHMAQRPGLVKGLSDAYRKSPSSFDAEEITQISRRINTIIAAARNEAEKQRWSGFAHSVLEKAERLLSKRGATKAVAYMLASFAHPDALVAAERKTLKLRGRAARRIESLGTRLHEGKRVEYYPLRDKAHSSVLPHQASLAFHEGQLRVAVQKGGELLITLPRRESVFRLVHDMFHDGHVRVFTQDDKRRLHLSGKNTVLVPRGSEIEIAGNRFSVEEADEKRLVLKGRAGQASGIEFRFHKPREVPIGREVSSGIRLMAWSGGKK